MKEYQKLYYIDVSGRLYTYTVTRITDSEIEIASDEYPEFKMSLTIGQAVMLFMKGSTLEDAKADAERRKALMGMQA